ncbi:MAG: hypothetical protein II885_07215 [Oscillospiraceae bacterium]|nr:hypothetical protein [Oscillospiraceae bacterium]
MLLRTANYFLDSYWFYIFHVESFFDGYSYSDDCFTASGKMVSFTTTIYDDFQRIKRLQWGFRDYHSGHSLPDWALAYFTKDLAEEQLAWAIFAAWYGLEKSRCDLIVKNKRLAGILLDYFLCGGSLEALEPIFVKGVSWKERRSAVAANIPDLPCTVIDGEKQLAGIRHGGEIILADTGERLSIGLPYEDLAQL